MNCQIGGGVGGRDGKKNQERVPPKPEHEHVPKGCGKRDPAKMVLCSKIASETRVHKNDKLKKNRVGHTRKIVNWENEKTPIDCTGTGREGEKLE